MALEQCLRLLSYPNAILFNLSAGVLVSILTWYLIVRLPERRRTRLLRENLSRRYQEFREDSIQILLWAAIGSHDSDLVRDLCDHRKFKEFFSVEEKKHWYAALNGMQGNRDYISDLLLEMELLANEISYVLSQIAISDPQVHAFFKRLNTRISRLRGASVYSYDQVKYLGQFMWELHARWSFVSGQREDDPIQGMIDALSVRS